MPTKDNQYEVEFRKDYENDWVVHQNYINTFDAYEAMLIGSVYDSVSQKIDGSKITDSYAATLAFERAARVMGKLPEGMTEATGGNDQGKAAFMDLLRQKWVYPNAKSQRPFKRKLKLWQLYGDVYGYMPMFYDWNIAKNGYVGPDCWLWSPRMLVFQQGMATLEDSEYVTALTRVSKSFLEGVMKSETKGDGWDRDAIKFLLEIVDGVRDNPDQDKDTKIVRDRTPSADKRGILLATRYEAGPEGEWITFAPDNACTELRRIKNPHKNSRIPFVIKYSQELFDSIYGLGDFQRAKPLQFARDALTNFYFKGIKMNLIPPLVANANGVLKHTLDYREGAVMLETIPNAIRQLNTSNAGLSTYQGAMSALTGSLLSLYGSQNASMPGAETLNPSQGKTPAAIDLYNNKEASRDGDSREALETAIEELTDGFNSLIVNIGTEDIPVDLFSDDIQAIVDAGMEDVMGIFTLSSVAKFQANPTQTGGVLKIDPKKLKGVEYRFNINPGSTEKENKQKQIEMAERVMTTVAKFQNQFKDDPRIDVNWPTMLKTYETLTGVKGISKFVTIKDAPSPAEQQLIDENRKLQDELNKVQHEQQLAQIDQATGKLTDAAGQVQQAMTPQAPTGPEPVTRTINGSGVYNDPELGAVADNIAKL